MPDRANPGLRAGPSAAEVMLALLVVERDHPAEVELLREAFALCESERFTYQLFRDLIEHMEQSTAARRDVAMALDRMRPVYERAVQALVDEVDMKRRATLATEQADADRREAAGADRKTALEHVRGAWAAVKSATENRAVVIAVGGAIGWLATKFFEVLTLWLQP